MKGYHAVRGIRRMGMLLPILLWLLFSVASASSVTEESRLITVKAVNATVTSPAQAQPGATVILSVEPTVDPDSGLYVADHRVTYRDGNQEKHTVPLVQDPGDSKKYSFTMPAYDVTVAMGFPTKWNWLSTHLSEGENITLLSDVLWREGDTPGPLVIPSGKEVTVDLNGFTIDRGLRDQPGAGDEENAAGEGKLFSVQGNLTLTDSSEGHAGKITGAHPANSEGAGVTVRNGGYFTLKGGSITDNRAVMGGGVYVEEGGVFVMEGGSISQNRADRSGGGVYNGSGSFTLKGGSIDHNAASAGAGVFNGAGIDAGGSFVMEDGEISNNVALADNEDTSGKGGGIYNNSKTTLALHGGKIELNEAAVEGGGVYIYRTEEAYPFLVSGSPVIRNNKRPGTEQLLNSNVLLPEGTTMTIDGELKSGAHIGIEAPDRGDYARGYGPFTSGYREHCETALPQRFFFGDTEDYGVFLRNDGQELMFAREFDGLLAALKWTPNGETISLSDYAGEDGRVVGMGKKDQPILSVGADKELTLDLAGCTLDRGVTDLSAEVNEFSGRCIDVLGKLTVKDSSPGEKGVITGSRAGGDYRNGCINVNGTFVLESGSISGNRCCGVLGNNKNAFFIMKGGRISNNSSMHACGVFFDAYGNSEVILEGGEISDNQGDGGVCCANITIRGGTITRNISVSSGGGVGIFDDSAFCHIEGGPIVIRDNVGNASWDWDTGEIVGGSSSDLRLCNTASVTGALAAGSSIGLMAEKPDRLLIRDYGKYNGGIDPERTFFSNDQDWVVRLSEDGDIVLKRYYKVTAEPVEHGRVSPDRARATEGETVTIVTTPDHNYKAEAVTVETGSGLVIEPARKDRETWTFAMPAEDVTVSATFGFGPPVLTIQYLYEDGTPAAEPYRQAVSFGTAYAVDSPAIRGYLADPPVVSGTMGDEDVTATVVYHRVYYTVAYDANGLEHAAVPSAERVPQYDPLTLEAAVPPLGGKHTFLYWSENKSGADPRYEAGKTYTFTKDTTLYAVWGETGIQATLHFADPLPDDVSNMPDDITVYPAMSPNVVIPDTVPKKSGRAFTGWNTKADGSGTAYAPGGVITLTAGKNTLYAQWAVLQNSWYIVYNANGGKNAPAGQTIPVGKDAVLSKEKPVSMAVFQGWSNDPAAKEATWQPGDTLSYREGVSTVTLYAVWKFDPVMRPVYITFDANGIENVKLPKNQWIENAGSLTLEAAVPPLGGTHTFLYWSENKSGADPRYEAGKTYTFTKDTTLYAQWWADPVTRLVTVSFDANGADDVSGMPPAVSVQASTAFLIPDQSPAWDAQHLFLGWGMSPNASEPVWQPGTSVLFAEDTVLYAIWNIQYRITDGAGSVWMKDSGVSHRFAADGNLRYFSEFRLDGKTLDPDLYTLASGSTVIRVSPEALQGLSVGKHTFEVVYRDGAASATFRVDKPVPKTGDDKPLLLWAGLILLGLAGMAMAAGLSRNSEGRG